MQKNNNEISCNDWRGQLLRTMLNLDFSKYKRFFAFGCSFTKYCWPSWADLLSKEMPNAEYFNFGLGGSGNQLISYRIAEANTRYKFTDTDLIMVMWTTYYREDRWVNGKWIAHGNIYNHHEGVYDETWIRKFADPKGYLIRDLAIMELTRGYLKSLHCTSICLNSVPVTFEEHNVNEKFDKTDNALLVYKEFIDNMHPTLLELEFNNLWKSEWNIDGHPTTFRYFSYLKKLGIELSSDTERYALKKTEDLLNCKNLNEAFELYKKEFNIEHKLL